MFLLKDCLGDKANATRPEIEQILISGKGVDEETFERELYVHVIERLPRQQASVRLYLASLSAVPLFIRHDVGGTGCCVLSQFMDER